MSTIRPTDLENTPLDNVAPLGGRPPPARREPLTEAKPQTETERVTLSSEVSASRTQAATFQVPVDEKKVQEMKIAMAEGRAPFDPKRVAAALLDETLARFPAKPTDR
jgi:flagellar biosynthesis anti-sigma factor FlgM